MHFLVVVFACGIYFSDPCMQVPTGFEMLSLVILTLGVVLAIWEGSASGSWLGISVAVASTLCGAAMLSFSGRVSCCPVSRHPLHITMLVWVLPCSSVLDAVCTRI